MPNTTSSVWIFSCCVGHDPVNSFFTLMTHSYGTMYRNDHFFADLQYQLCENEFHMVCKSLFVIYLCQCLTYQDPISNFNVTKNMIFSFL